MSETLTPEERKALHDSVPCDPETVDGWEWGVLDRAVERILAARLADRDAALARVEADVAERMTAAIVDSYSARIIALETRIAQQQETVESLGEAHDQLSEALARVEALAELAARRSYDLNPEDVLAALRPDLSEQPAQGDGDEEDA